MCVVTNVNVRREPLPSIGLDDLPLISSDECKNGVSDKFMLGKRSASNKGVRLRNATMCSIRWSIVFEDSRAGINCGSRVDANTSCLVQ